MINCFISNEVRKYVYKSCLALCMCLFCVRGGLFRIQVRFIGQVFTNTKNLTAVDVTLWHTFNIYKNWDIWTYFTTIYTSGTLYNITLHYTQIFSSSSVSVCVLYHRLIPRVITSQCGVLVWDLSSCWLSQVEKICCVEQTLVEYLYHSSLHQVSGDTTVNLLHIYTDDSWLLT